MENVRIDPEELRLNLGSKKYLNMVVSIEHKYS